MNRDRPPSSPMQRPTPSTRPLATGWPAAIILAVLAMLILLRLAAGSSLWDRDEPRFARAAVEMVQSGNYLYPTLFGHLRADKPILIYWLMAGGLKLLGPCELAVRLPSVLAAGATLLLTYAVGRRLATPGVGLLAAAILATTPMLTYIGTAAVADSVLLACLMLAMLATTLAVTGRMTLGLLLLLGLSLGLALLTKGPPALLPLVSMIVIGVLGRRQLPLGRDYWLAIPLALALALAMFIAWGLPANVATDGGFLQLGIGKHVIGRISAPMEGHGGNSPLLYFLWLFFYFPIIIAFFFPWTIYLPAAIALIRQPGDLPPAPRIVLLAWSLPTFIIMSLVATKLQHYILPMWPALAIAAALVIHRLRGHGLSPTQLTWFRRGLHQVGIGGIVVGLAVIAGPWLAQAPALRVPCALLGITLALTCALAVVLHRRQRHLAAVASLVVGMVMFQGLAAVSVLPAVEGFKLSPPIARAVTQRVGPDVAVFSHGYHEPSLTFYMQRISPVFPLEHEAQVVRWARRPGKGVLIIPRDKLARIEAAHGPLGLEEFASARGMNIAKARPADLVALGRNLPPAPAFSR